MRRNGFLANVSGGLLVAALASTAWAGQAPIDRLCGPPGLQLGMTVESWKALAFPNIRADEVQPICSDDLTAANFLGVAFADGPGRPLVCGYANRIGTVFLRNSVTVLGGYPATMLRYHFPAGQLTEIDCLTSDNAFTAAHARFDHLYGPAKEVVRDQVRTEVGLRPRVKETWAIPGGRVTMIDPARPANDLMLQYRWSGG